jgi:hypothetical protein
MLATTFAVQAAATWALAGLIWTIQVVHYPMLAGIAPDRYTHWQRHHMTRITWLVGPLMIVEALTAGLALLLAVRAGDDELIGWSVVGLALLVAIWLSTAVFQAPIHGRLRAGFDAALHRRLVRTNWLRTVAWTLRGLLLLYLGAIHG